MRSYSFQIPLFAANSEAGLRRYLRGAQDYYKYAEDFRNGSKPGVLAPATHPSPEYSTLRYTQEAERIIAAHPKTDPEKPLFLYLAYQAVHNPYDVAPERDAAPFGDIKDPTRRA